MEFGNEELVVGASISKKEKKMGLKKKRIQSIIQKKQKEKKQDLKF